MSFDFDSVEEELGVDLPVAYRDFMAAFEDASRTETPYAHFVIDDANSLIALNERFLEEPLAGFDEWPEDYVLFGEDGCGNYYAFDAASEEAQVFFYNHESDELVVEADSLMEFGQQLASPVTEQATSSGESDPEVISSGYAKRKRDAARSPRVVESLPAESFTEDWQTDWASFVREVLFELGSGLGEGEITSNLNARFGSLPISWVGVVEKIELGEHKSVFIEMPECPHLPGWEKYSWGAIHPSLRTEEESWHNNDGRSKQMLTSIAAWAAVSPGDTIRFQMVIAPGYGDQIACIRRNQYGTSLPPQVSVQDCGGHVVEILGTQ